MDVLIVEPNPELGKLWSNSLERLGIATERASDPDEALALLHSLKPDVIVVDLDLPGSGAMAIADYAGYRHPEARVVFVTASSFFSDGSIFSVSPNAAAFLPARTPPEDLAAVVEFHGRRRSENG